MLKKLKIAFLSIFIVGVTINCNNIEDNVSLTLQPYKVKDSILNVVIKNNTNNDYFLTLDINRSYGYSFFNYKINNSVIITPKVYENDKFIYPKLEGRIYKKEFLDRREEEWNKKEIILADTFLANFVLLKNKIMLKRGESKFLKIPFKLIYPYNYNLKNKYALKKGKKYELQIEYQMQKTTTEKIISKIKLDSIEKIGYLPYYEKIISNKVPIIID